MESEYRCLECGVPAAKLVHGRCASCRLTFRIGCPEQVPASLHARTAEAFLQHGIDLLRERGKQYDQPDGERSMGKTVAAFNAITGRDLSEAEGWLLMLLLKQVRQWQTPTYHKDSADDAVSYSALLAEALERSSAK